MRTQPDQNFCLPPVFGVVVILATVLTGLLSASLPAQEGAPKAKAPPEAAAATTDPAVTAATTPLTAFGRQIPALRPNRGVWIPSFANGARSSLVEADVVTRVDDNRLEAENMTISLYGAESKENVEIALRTATYHMAHQILRSDDRSRVSRADFDLEGDSLVFDTLTSQGRMTGNVRMTIHDTRGFMETMNKSNAADAKGADAAKDPSSVTIPAAPATSTTTSSSSRRQSQPAPKP